MKWWAVLTEEYNGYECEGHLIPHIVAANSKQEAIDQFEWDEYWQQKPNATELVLPDLRRKKKPFVFKWEIKP